ncbi:MAG TPA: hypothetical protein VFR81_20920 [Longimicrobium sp.]|nr:hypothetical protein [Longimicrobium sp.]
MRKMKLKLDVENLTVESFGTEAPERGRGTVHARGASEYGTCVGNTCWDTCSDCPPSYPDYCPPIGSGLNPSCVWTCPGWC